MDQAGAQRICRYCLYYMPSQQKCLEWKRGVGSKESCGRWIEFTGGCPDDSGYLVKGNIETGVVDYRLGQPGLKSQQPEVVEAEFPGNQESREGKKAMHKPLDEKTVNKIKELARSGRVLTGHAIAKKLGLSSSVVYKYINQMKEEEKREMGTPIAREEEAAQKAQDILMSVDAGKRMVENRQVMADSATRDQEPESDPIPECPEITQSEDWADEMLNRVISGSAATVRVIPGQTETVPDAPDNPATAEEDPVPECPVCIHEPVCRYRKSYSTDIYGNEAWIIARWARCRYLMTRAG